MFTTLLLIIVTTNSDVQITPINKVIVNFEPKNPGKCISKDYNGGMCAAAGSY